LVCRHESFLSRFFLILSINTAGKMGKLAKQYGDKF